MRNFYTAKNSGENPLFVTVSIFIILKRLRFAETFGA